jgi:xanthine dehydrogenase accessory factor
MIAASGARAEHRFALGATLGQCCGGVMNLEFEAVAADAHWTEPVAVRTADFHLVLFGAGHVGRAVVKVLSEIPCAITWVDSREDEFPQDIPANVQCVCTFDPECEIDAAVAGSYFLVMTHSHALDQTLSERILRRADFAYFGLIGSLTKRRQFERRLQDRGISAAQLAGMSCPIGAEGIYGKEPATIAIAVAAEILQRRSKLARAESVTTRIAS